MGKMQKKADQCKNKKATGSGNAGLLFLAVAAVLLPARPLGGQFVAFGEKLEKLARAAKISIYFKKKNPAPKTGLCENDQGVFSTEESKIVIPEPEKADASIEPNATEPSAPEFTANGDLGLIDAAAEPDRYAELLEREKKGEIELVRRFRRSYESRLIQSKDPMQDYYSGIKNALLRYKGVKSRISWANETFHQGRNHLAKIIVKTSCLYIYLSVDPGTLKGTKFESAVEDVSETKKFGEFPTAIKIKGERKYKYALELIDRICAEDLQLQLNKKFAPVDYRRPAMTDEELTEQGLVKLLVAAIEKPRNA